MIYYIVSCEYIEYDSDGQFVCENEDPVAGEFTNLQDAQAFVEELRSDPAVFKTYIQTSDTPL